MDTSYAKVMKVCFLAPTGYGKTTAANIIKENYNSTNIKLSEPLYELQNLIHSFIGMEMGTRQDGELLQFLGNKIQTEKPEFLALKFYNSMMKKICDNKYSIVTNDDCRPHNYRYLKDWGFKFIKIEGYSRSRNDHTKVDPNHIVEWNEGDIPYDYLVENKGSIEEYKNNLLRLMEVIVND